MALGARAMQPKIVSRRPKVATPLGWLSGPTDQAGIASIANLRFGFLQAFPTDQIEICSALGAGISDFE
jgi:hypothetical protein